VVRFLLTTGKMDVEKGSLLQGYRPLHYACAESFVSTVSYSHVCSVFDGWNRMTPGVVESALSERPDCSDHGVSSLVSV
jgi:hypothetical protein